MGKEGKSGNAAVNQEEPTFNRRKPQANYLQYPRGDGDSFHKSRLDLKDA